VLDATAQDTASLAFIFLLLPHLQSLLPPFLEVPAPRLKARNPPQLPHHALPPRFHAILVENPRDKVDIELFILPFP